MERHLAAVFVIDVAGFSRLMEQDEVGTLACLSDLRKTIFTPTIKRHHGRVVKFMGDGALVEFTSVVDAVSCAVEFQREVADRNTGSNETRIDFRIGIHLGDIIVEGDDIFGDGVNVAARLQGLAKPGGICVSQQAVDLVESKLDLAFEDLGRQRVKNISRLVHVYDVRLKGRGDRAEPRAHSARRLHQDVHFCTASDGVQIAYAAVGEGPLVVKTANWLNHLEYDWESPIWSHLLHRLSLNNRLVRYDARGNGLSDWEVDEISFDAFVRDLETVVDSANLERFTLFGVSQGCAVSIAYAVRHPERVKSLVLYGGFTRGRRKRGAEDAAQSEAFLTLMRQGWGQDNPVFRQMFTSLFVPEGTTEQIQWFNDLQRVTTSPENAVRIRSAVDDIDVTELLPKIQAPALVLHCRSDAVQPFEEGRRMAALIPGAQFVALEGRNHLILESEPACGRFLDEVTAFLANNDSKQEN